MKPPGQVGNGENYPSLDSPNRGFDPIAFRFCAPVSRPAIQIAQRSSRPRLRQRNISVTASPIYPRYELIAGFGRTLRYSGSAHEPRAFIVANGHRVG
jgi:hypothetical protein